MAAKDDFDWKAILEGAECFHFTGITLALNDNVAGICLETCKAALTKRMEFFNEMGRRISDHSLDYAMYVLASEAETEEIFAKAMSGGVQMPEGCPSQNNPESGNCFDVVTEVIYKRLENG